MSEQANEGRDSNGRFTQGNKGGPGNPFARRTAEMRKAIAKAISPEDLAAIAVAMKEKALKGDVAAAKLVFSYAAGQPAQPADPDTLDADELATRRRNTAQPEDMKSLFERCPAWLMCALAAAVAPEVQGHMAEELAKGVRRQGEAEEKGRKHAPDAPGPYPGMKADWKPAWLGKRLPEELSLLLESCPAWMPDYYGRDRTEHVYADMLRSLRGGLLERLEDGPEAGVGGQRATRPVTERSKP